MNDIAREWLRYAKGGELPQNDYNRFIAAYIALNNLYGWNPENEETRMTNCLVSLCDRNHIDPFTLFDFESSAYHHPGVQDMRSGFNNIKTVNKGDRDSLFRAIYQVRCNLFHGNKSLGSERDTNLVKQGADVIIGILSKALGL